MLVFMQWQKGYFSKFYLVFMDFARYFYGVWGLYKRITAMLPKQRILPYNFTET